MKLPTIGKKAPPAPTRAQKKPGRSSGRVTASKQSSGRYTPPIPTTVRRSPRWYPYALITLLLAGVIIIILNYIAVLPDSPTNWYTLASLIAIVVAALAATNYR